MDEDVAAGEATLREEERKGWVGWERWREVLGAVRSGACTARRGGRPVAIQALPLTFINGTVAKGRFASCGCCRMMTVPDMGRGADGSHAQRHTRRGRPHAPLREWRVVVFRATRSFDRYDRGLIDG